MKIVFMGTPDFSAIVLEKLNASYSVAAAVTGPDKPVGRGHKLAASPLKLKAEELCIPVLQFEKVSKTGIEIIENLRPDVIVTAAFGQILSERFLSIPKYGVLNVHASLLPKYRGAAPIQWAILNGDKVTGVTIMRTVRQVDAGDILLQKSLQIGENETSGELFDRLAVLGGEAIIEAISMIESGRAIFIPQDESAATHCGMIAKSDGKLDFSRTCAQLRTFVRGMTPWPSAYAFLDGKMLKVFEIEKVSDDCSHDTGEIVFADAKRGLCVQAADGIARLKVIQSEGSRRMSDADFLRGRLVKVGARL